MVDVNSVVQQLYANSEALIIVGSSVLLFNACYLAYKLVFKALDERF